jgi:hypothetical protein
LSITESITNNPERFRLVFYNMPPSIIDCYDSNGQDYAASYMYGGQIQPQRYQSPHNNTEANASVIVDEAEKLYNKVVKDCINKAVIIDRPFNKPSSLPLLPPSNAEQQSHMRSSPIAVNKTHTYEQEHTFIQSEEVDNEDNNKEK